MQNNDIITVTSPLLPDLNEFHELLHHIWDSKWITNNGDFHKKLEDALAEYQKAYVEKSEDLKKLNEEFKEMKKLKV